MKPIYLDYMATTPVDPQVVAVMQACLDIDGTFGNPATTTHEYGYVANEAIQHARAQVASLINADPREVIFTSGATEADNLAITGVANFHRRSGRHIITVKTEHAAVLDTCHALSHQGFEITYLDVLPSGLLDLTQLTAAIRPDTLLISVMHLNNETGVIQDIAAIGEIAHRHGVLFHVDAAQSVGKLPIDCRALPVDLLSFSAHKIYGPKGIGGLFVSRQPRVRLSPLLHGGGHEWGFRSGTLATHQIAAMGAAFAIAEQRMADDYRHMEECYRILTEALAAYPQVRILGEAASHYPGCANIFVPGVRSEVLLASLPELAMSEGSACHSADSAPSHVLMACGLTPEQAKCSFRMSMGRNLTTSECQTAVDLLVDRLSRLLV